MDKIFLHGMQAQTLIGVYEWERQNKQTIVFDLDIGIETPQVPTDDIGTTVHYGDVCARVRADVAARDFLLLESLAEHVARFLFESFDKIVWLRLRLCKPGILPDVREVGVEIERSRPAPLGRVSD
ncbi:dihydroneopterin aldolase [Conchiformibius kuhniae]|uniref:Dihydroneopterin aldolase n=1 Tax=Conchiformibius kuhniae TaxID=211502 RepID=A0A8T9MZK7_9NEIS|nr:dihydroneopterin aldolase [Conchiformibius kuhniae]UOP05223.1 dihydroneopterin aldolase [Conchiformibius kuhniae]